MLTGEQYRESIRGRRESYLDGQRIADPTTHPHIRPSVDWVAETYDRFYSAEPGAVNPMFVMPRTPDELKLQMERLLASDLTAAQTAGCVALGTVAPQLGAVKLEYQQRLEAFIRRSLDADVRVAAARQDAGALRVVERNDRGIVLKGAKQHVIGAPIVHELFVVPARQMKPDEADLAVSCAVPADSPGVKMVSITTAPRSLDTRHYPVSRHQSMPASIVLFDNVLVPWERVFLDGEVALSSLLGDTLGIWERARSVAEQAEMAELMLGLAQTIAEMNGIPNIDHIKDKLSSLTVYAAMCRAAWETALANSRVTEGGMVCPDESFVYAGKAYGTQLFSDMVGYLHDVAGGLIVTVPGMADVENPDIGAYITKYMRTYGSVSGVDRMKVFHLIRDLTADTYGYWAKVNNQHVAGGIFASRQAAHRTYDLEGVRAKVRDAMSQIEVREPAANS